MRTCALLVPILALLPFLVTASPSLRALQDEGSSDEDDMLELQVRAYNAPPDALDSIVADATKYMQFLLDGVPEYSGLEPGDAVEPEDRRELLTSEMEDSSSDKAPETSRMIRGASSPSSSSAIMSERSLQMRSCPLTCAKSSSTTCKQLGCAYCGTRCRRRRKERRQERQLQAFGGHDAAKIAAKINARLLKACGTDPDCVIYVKIGRLSTQDGVEVEEPVV